MKKSQFETIISISSFSYVASNTDTIVQWFFEENLFREITVPHSIDLILGTEFVTFKDFNFCLIIITKFDVFVISMSSFFEEVNGFESKLNTSERKFQDKSKDLIEQTEFIEFKVELPFPVSSFKNFGSGILIVRDLEYLTTDILYTINNDDIFSIFDDPFRECSFLNFEEEINIPLNFVGCSKLFSDRCFLVFADENLSVYVYKLTKLPNQNRSSMDINDYNCRYTLSRFTSFTNQNKLQDVKLNLSRSDYFDYLFFEDYIYFVASFKKENINIEVLINNITSQFEVCWSENKDELTDLFARTDLHAITFQRNGKYFIYNPFKLHKIKWDISSCIEVPPKISFEFFSLHVQKCFQILETSHVVKFEHLFCFKILFFCLRTKFEVKSEIEVFGIFFLILTLEGTGSLTANLDVHLLAWKDKLMNKTIYTEWFTGLRILHEELLLNVMETDACQNLALILFKCSICLEMPSLLKNYYFKASYSLLKRDNFIGSILEENILVNFEELENVKKCILPWRYDEYDYTDPYSSQQIEFSLDIMEYIYKFAKLVENVKLQSILDIKESTEYKTIRSLSFKIEHSEYGNIECLPRISKISKIFNNFVQSEKTDSFASILKDFNVDEYFLSTLPIGLSAFIKKLALEQEEILCNLSDLKETNIHLLFFRKDLKNTYISLGNENSAMDVTKDNIFNTGDTNFLLAAKILAFMLPLNNGNLFDNKITYAERDSVKLNCFIRQICKPVGWGFLLYGSKKSYVFTNEEKFAFEKINYCIKSIFNENSILTNNNHKKFIPMQFINKAEFQSGISNALAFSKNLSGLDFMWVMQNKPKILNPQFGGFLYGLGLQGYLKQLEEWQIYNVIVNKYTPVSIGMLLGISCSKLGSCNNLITKLLGIHLEQSLPSKSIDLNHHYTLQIAALVSFGLLYLNSFDIETSRLLQECIVGKVAINGIYCHNESYTIAAGVALGLINLNGTNNNINNIKNVLLLDSILDVIESKKTEYVVGPLMSICLMCLRSENLTLTNRLSAIFENGCDEYDFQVNFYYNFVKSVILWEEISEDWLDIAIKKFDSTISVFENPFNLNVIPSYYEVAGIFMAYSMKNVGLRSEKFKKVCLMIVDRLVTLTKIKCISSYSLKLALKHFYVVLNIVLEAVSLNYCSSADVDILKRCKFILTDESQNISDDYRASLKNKHTWKENFTAQNIHSNKPKTDAFADMMKYSEILTQLETPDGYLADESSSDEEEDNDEGDDEEIQEGINMNDINADTDKNPGYIEKIGFVSEKYSFYSAASFSMGLLLLGGSKKMINISSENKNLAFLILSMLPVTNQFPFELQELRYLYLLAVDTCYLTIKDCDSNEELNVTVDCYLKDKPNSIIKIQSPSSLMNIEDLEAIVIDDIHYHKIRIDQDVLLAKKNRDFVIYLQSKKDNTDKTNILNNFLKEETNKNYDYEESQFKEMLLNEQHLKSRDWNLDLLTVSKDLTTNNLDLWHMRR